MKEYTIRVYNDAEGEPAYDDFRVNAESRIDARVIAFCLDGGSEHHPDPSALVHLALVWTKVLT